MQERWRNSTVDRERLLAGLLIAAGAALRVWQYLANRSLWVDEAALAGSILPGSYSELTQSLDARQVAPVGFLWIEKAVTSAFGGSEYSLRLLPLLAGLISLFLFRSLARRVLAAGPALLALALFAFNRWLVFYSSDLKQYSTDVLACTWLLLVSVRCLQSPPNRAGAIGFALGGFGAGFLSHPALLISGSVLATTLAARIRRREPGLAILSRLSFVWTVGSAASVAWSLRSTAPEVRLYLREYWQRHGGMPAAAEGWTALPRWIAQAVREAAGSLADATFLPGRLEWALGVVLAIAAAAGALRLWRSNRVRAAVLTLPILAAVASAVVDRYPVFRTAHLVPLPLVPPAARSGVRVDGLGTAGRDSTRLDPRRRRAGLDLRDPVRDGSSRALRGAPTRSPPTECAPEGWDSFLLALFVRAQGLSLLHNSPEPSRGRREVRLSRAGILASLRLAGREPR